MSGAVSNVVSAERFARASCFHGTKFKSQWAVETLKDRNRHGKVT